VAIYGATFEASNQLIGTLPSGRGANVIELVGQTAFRSASH